MLGSLRQFALFSGVSDRALATITREMLRYYTDGQVILREGQPGTSFFIILKGKSRVTLDGIFLVSRSAGWIVGEQALIDGVARSATVTAEGTVEAVEISADLFHKLLQDPQFTANLLKHLSAKLTEATGDRAFRYRNEERLFAEFSAHVAPEVRDRLLALGGSYGDPRYIDAAILMADVRSFTERSSRMEPITIATELSPYLDAVVDIIHRHDGFVDKFIGDAVLAVWGITPTCGVLTSKALACAKEMLATAAQMRFGGEPIKIGVGLNYGRVFVGNVGGVGKRQFTVLGTPVNMTQRYESETKATLANIVAGEAFYQNLPQHDRTGWTAHQRNIKGIGEQIVYACAVSTGLDQSAQIPEKGQPHELEFQHEH